MSTCLHNSNTRGFSLLEILVAIAVFSWIALIATQGIWQLLLNHDAQLEQQKKQKDWQVSYALLRADIEQFVNRPVRSHLTQVLPAFVSNEVKSQDINQQSAFELFSLTRGGLVNPDNRYRQSALARVSYHIQGQHLIRNRWPQLDIAPTKAQFSQTLMSNIAHIDVQYLDKAGRLASLFRPSASEPGPRAVLISIETTDEEQYQWLLPVG